MLDSAQTVLLSASYMCNQGGNLMLKNLIVAGALVSMLAGCQTAVQLGERDAEKEEYIAQVQADAGTEQTNIEAWSDALSSTNRLAEVQARALADVAIAQVHANKDTNLKAMDIAFAEWQAKQQAGRTTFWLKVLIVLIAFASALSLFLVYCAGRVSRRAEDGAKYPYLHGGYMVQYPKEVTRCDHVDSE
jgi:hypothetical protein